MTTITMDLQTSVLLAKLATYYVDLLKMHDWSHEYSDDHQRYLNGNLKKQMIQALQPFVDRSYTIYNTHAPKARQRVS